MFKSLINKLCIAMDKAEANAPESVSWYVWVLVFITFIIITWVEV